ncbi:MAG: efflux RND transporter permease subunit, partial [candidate division NC10 bacterium]|nr:efflux RND transporter permease subunit [candidate division NC10 bacterium]
HRQMGKGRLQAAIDGATEVWGAVLASTLTTVVVFLPILFVKEEAGQLFRAIAVAISVSILFSLVVSLTVVPMLSSRLLTGTEDQLRRSRLGRFLDPLLNLLDRFGGGFVGAVVGLLDWLRRSFIRRLAAAGIITVLAVALAYLFLPPMDYLPQGNRNLIFAYIKTPPGLNIEDRERIVAELEKRYLEMKELKYIFGVVRTDFSLVGVLAKDEYKDQSNMRRIVAGMQKRAFGIPGAKGIFVTQSPLFRRRFAFIGGTNIDIDIKGDDLETIQQITGKLQDGLRTLKEVNFVNTEFEVGSPELQIHVDREKASNLGLSVGEVGYVIETMVNGTLAGQFRERGKELDIKLKGPVQEINRTQDLDRIIFHTPSGRIVRLSDIAEVRSEIGPTKVEHVDLDRAIKLTANIRGDIPLESAITLVNEKVVGPARAQLPLGYAINVTGQAKDLDITWSSIKWALLLALIVDYLLMCSLFESWLNPLIIMFSVPLAALGGVLGVKLAHLYEPATKMDVITMLGFIILAGTVVNNAILIVHQSLNFMQEGFRPQEAILESVRTRIRPIFMTTTTTVFGMLPLVISTGAGSELYRGLGAAVLGGLSMSTLFTLVLVPVLFSLWLDVREAIPVLRKVPVGAQKEAMSYLNGGEQEEERR